MTLNKLTLLIGVTALAFDSAAFAGGGQPPTSTTTYVTSTSSTTRGVDNGYGGLKWTFGEGWAPAVVVGYRHAEVSTNGDTQGADISFAFKVFNGFQPEKLRVKYLNGKDYLQGEVGGGYDFTKGFFAGIGMQGPYVNTGVDYIFSASSPLAPYLGFNSLGIYNRPHVNTTTPTTTLSCPLGWDLVGNFCVDPGA